MKRWIQNVWQARWRRPDNTYGVATHGLLRGLGLVYFFAFWSFAAQAGGLIGPGGLSPISQTLEEIRSVSGNMPFLRAPSLFWLSEGMGLLYAVLGLGAFSALFMVAGKAVWWANLIAWVSWVSLMQVSGPWMRFQGDFLLAEVGFAAFFLSAPRQWSLPVPRDIPLRRVGLWMCNLILVKVMFSSAWVKLTGGDPFWMRETALHVYFETQPLPTLLAWFLHQLPGSALKYSLWGVLLIETVLPFYVFFPRTYRQIAAGGFSVLMLLIVVSGNYGHYPWLVILLSFALVDDRAWREWLPEKWAPAPADPTRVRKRVGGAAWVWMFLWAPVCLGGIWLRQPEAFWPPWRETARVLQQAGASGVYGMFPSVRPHRFEVEVQGSRDGQQWREYLFKAKPGHPQRLPRFSGLHFPRLDWKMADEISAGASNPAAIREHPWMFRLAEGLLTNDPRIVSLLDINPFSDQPPNHLRFVTYQVRYTDPVTRRERGVWWQRSVRGLYGPVMSRQQ
ncbi:MAG: lipase maturation factor family protein [Verrucomicrobia bacterium]|nr:lipase maturation factor family protein [Verrucomicrobiota bacterium]MCH8510533.1 lipase maturation factor family protein [Kiritimatiellia bacterium]